jgi:hypothetical protein
MKMENLKAKVSESARRESQVKQPNSEYPTVKSFRYSCNRNIENEILPTLTKM